MGTLSLSKSATVVGLHLSEVALLVFGVIVVVGLIGELKLPWWHPRIELFELFVIIGVAGELIADGGVFAFSEHLQSISGIEVASLNHEVNTAKSRADDEEIARLRLELALIPKALNTEDQREIANLCRPFAHPDIPIIIESTAGNGRQLAVEIRNALNMAGFLPQPLKVTTQAWYDIRISAPSRYGRVAKAISDALAGKLIIAYRPYAAYILLPPGSPIIVSVGEPLPALSDFPK
ncbi:MAG: hypothetical protein WB992_00715 [Bryobacteraceae bacterium]